MKTIEQQIEDKRNQLDFENPPDGTWNEVVKGWKTETSESKNYKWWKLAAAVFFVSSIGLLIYSLTLKQEVNELASLGDISPEYQKIETSYRQEITQLMSTLPIEEIQSNPDLSWAIDEMQTLDEINKQYREDIGETIDQELLIRALLDYYEKKIRLLKKLELEINRQNNEKATNTNYSTI